MDLAVRINQTGPNSVWTSLIDPICDECGWALIYKYHSGGRTLFTMECALNITEGYYECINEECSNNKPVVARHPERIPYKKYSKSVLAQIIFLRRKKNRVEQILEKIPFLSESTIYRTINDYRAVRRATADERISKKFPPGTVLSVAIDAMEPEKGQPALYTVREVETGTLLNAKFLEKSAAEDIYEVLNEIERKYQIKFKGFISDKQRSIDKMCEKYFEDVLHQYCTVHFMKNVTAELRGLDKSLQKNLRSDVRKLSILRTIDKNANAENPALDEKEIKVLSETRTAILAVANEKKKEMFDLAGKRIYENFNVIEDRLFKEQKAKRLKFRTKKYEFLVDHLSKKVGEIVKKYEDGYYTICLVNDLIHPMFDAVFNSHPKHPKRAFNKVKKSWEKILKNKNTPRNIDGLMNEALRLAKSYENGLFVWRRAKVPHHNNDTERSYNEEKGGYRQFSHNKKIGVTLQLTGLEEAYIPKSLTLEEIESDLLMIGSEKYWEVKREMEGRREMRRFKKHCRNDIKGSLKKIFSHFDT